ncbi:hypothetical protein HAX54_005116, partial [Datura stramonium]|nr:hypothetical protein [Datura stramonium]
MPCRIAFVNATLSLLRRTPHGTEGSCLAPSIERDLLSRRVSMHQCWGASHVPLPRISVASRVPWRWDGAVVRLLQRLDNAFS